MYDEWLRCYSLDGKEQLWFERRFDPTTEQTQWRFDGPLIRFQELLEERTRDNSLILSTRPRENVKPLIQVFEWFQKKLWIFDLSRAPDALKRRTTELCHKYDSLKLRVAKMLNDADFQIDGFSISKEDFSLPDISTTNETQSQVALALNNMISVWQESLGKVAQKTKVQTQHHLIDSDDIVAFDLEEESNGTQRFFAIAAPFLHALDTGTVMMVDELDCSLHPNLTRKLIELFQSPSANSLGAQLIFTTHDSTLLDQRLFRRDQMYLVEKMHNRGSEYFSLYDFDNKDRPRNTEALQRNYLSGRYGAIPHFGPTFEDFQLP